MIYLIKQIWIDSMENSVELAVGYNIVGYVDTQAQAEQYCSHGRIYTKKDCWAVWGEIPEFIWTAILHL